MSHCCHSLPAAVRVFRLHLLGRHSRDWWDRVVLKEFSGEERWEEVWNFLQGFFKSLQWWREACVSRVGQRTLQRRCKWQPWLCKILVRSVSSFISNPASVTIYTLTTTCFVHTTYSEVRWNVLVHVNIPNEFFSHFHPASSRMKMYRDCNVPPPPVWTLLSTSACCRHYSQNRLQIVEIFPTVSQSSDPSHGLDVAKCPCCELAEGVGDTLRGAG